MNYNITATSQFSRELKKLTKKYISLKEAFLALLKSLKDNPTQGNLQGNDTFKIKLAIRSKSSGKRGGDRVITFVRIVESEIILLGIYDKSEQESISIEEINQRIKNFLP